MCVYKRKIVKKLVTTNLNGFKFIINKTSAVDLMYACPAINITRKDEL